MPTSPASRHELKMLVRSINNRFNNLDRLIEKINISVNKTELDLERIAGISNLSEEISWILGNSVTSSDERHIELSTCKNNSVNFSTIMENFNKMKLIITNFIKRFTLHDNSSKPI